MDLVTRKIDDIFVIDVDGEIDSDTSTVFKRSLKYALDRGEKYIIINLEDVNFITSVGIGILLDLYKKLKNKGGRLILVNVKELVRDILGVTRLDSVFHIMESEEAAIQVISSDK